MQPHSGIPPRRPGARRHSWRGRRRTRRRSWRPAGGDRAVARRVRLLLDRPDQLSDPVMSSDAKPWRSDSATNGCALSEECNDGSQLCSAASHGVPGPGFRSAPQARDHARPAARTGARPHPMVDRSARVDDSVLDPTPWWTPAGTRWMPTATPQRGEGRVNRTREPCDGTLRSARRRSA